MKPCFNCKLDKPLSEYHKKGTRLASRCKDCIRIYRAENYKNWSPEQRSNLAKKNKERLNANIEKLRKYKTENPCTDCGEYKHFAAMDFDHIVPGTKTSGVSRLVAHGSWKRIEQEIALCELVCSNCHRVRTWNRLGIEQ